MARHIYWYAKIISSKICLGAWRARTLRSWDKVLARLSLPPIRIIMLPAFKTRLEIPAYAMLPTG